MSSQRLWLYKRPFRADGVDGLVLLDTGISGIASQLLIDGQVVATDATPATGREAVRNHHLRATLADGRTIEVEAGYINWFNTAIAVRIDGALVHESNPGRRIAYPERARRMVEGRGDDGAGGFDPDKFKRNRVPIMVDIATGLLFFVVAKLTDLKTAALVGAAVGIALLVAQRFVKVDLIGGLALFGIFMLLVSAGFAIAFDDEELIKQRSTVVGLLGAGLFLADGLLLRGRRLGRGMSRYIALNDIDERRLAIGMGVAGAVMALANWIVVKLVSTDVWLIYTTFIDMVLAIGLVLVAINWSRRGSARTGAAAFTS